MPDVPGYPIAPRTSASLGGSDTHSIDKVLSLKGKCGSGSQSRSDHEEQ
jgi:hypothetical protein